MIVDSNLVIYAAHPENAELLARIGKPEATVSAATRIEVLGFHKLAADDEAHFEQYFAAISVIPMSDAIVDQAIVLRQRRKMELGDTLIAATALVTRQQLWTHNVADFRDIPDLVVFDPLAEDAAPPA